MSGVLLDAYARVTLAAEFPDWQITDMPVLTGGQCEAFWSTPDGRERQTVTAASAAELLERLREIRTESS